MLQLNPHGTFLRNINTGRSFENLFFGRKKTFRYRNLCIAERIFHHSHQIDQRRRQSQKAITFKWRNYIGTFDFM